MDSQFVPRPVRAPLGGQTATVTLTATQGTIYYTKDGSDPRLPGGAIAPGALTLTSGASAAVTASTFLVARAKNGALWSAPSTGYYFTGPAASASNLIITELHYHPADPNVDEIAAGYTNSDEFEFIELMNASAGNIDLSGSRFTAGIDFTFPLGTILSAGERLIIVANRDAFAVRHPEIPFADIAGEYVGDRLENAGELIRLVAAGGSVILEFTYGTTGLWPTEADGPGRSLALTKASTSVALSNPLSWRASAADNGTPLGGDATSYAAWKTANAVSSDSIDIDGDGIFPFAEYANGTDPQVPGVDRLPVVQQAANGDWILSISRALAAEDADFTIQTATDLAGWADAAVTIESRTATNDTETYTCRLPGVLAQRFFVRCRWKFRP